MSLSGKQVRQLRSLAHHLNPIIHIGKSDITDSLVKETDAALEARELIKCAVQDGSGLDVREAAESLAERTNADIVQIIGHRFSIYRESSRDDIEKIKLV
ncbi:MAG: ribosome assembly RNA-binding protein YhbY [Collinsella sp.]|nr:ribosome assembly RNA-binding protein YhbY [Collinsella sp.]